LIIHARRQKEELEDSTMNKNESRCYNITLLQDCDISGAGNAHNPGFE
jgi:hypothetical protein